MSATIAVLGLGGVGGMLASRIGALCVGTERTVATIQGKGLTLVHGEETTVTHPQAMARLEQPVSLLLVAVKAYDLDDALDRVAPEAIAEALVVPLLNGLEHVDAIRERYASSPAAPVVVAASIGTFQAFSPEPGIVVQRTPSATITAASQSLEQTALAAALEPLAVTGIEVVVEDDERAVLWHKAARLSVLAAATAASARTIGELRDDPAWRERLRAGLAEAAEVARAEGVAVPGDEQWAIIEAMSPDLTTSTARDAAAGRPTELDAITGSVIRAARRLDVATPMLTALYEEARWRGR